MVDAQTGIPAPAIAQTGDLPVARIDPRRSGVRADLRSGSLLTGK
jgi:hypothetical protein